MDFVDHMRVIMELNNEDLLKIRGGALNATMINAIVRGIDIMIDLGRSIGSAIRRLQDNNKCTY